MDVTPLVRQGQQIIQSYSGGHFKINGKVFESAVIVQPAETAIWDYAGTFEDLSEGDFKPISAQADDIDVVLLGCGAQMKFFPPVLRQKLRDKGLSIEVMDTGAACRTYNVLMAEGRRVAAILLPST